MTLTLQRSLTRDGVYLGVGPEQNFTYIANLRPRFAVIFDIRRQNAMQHLMYKALFELAPTRAEFVALLFSRPAVSTLAPATAAVALFDSATAAVPDDSAFQANRAAMIDLLTGKHGFALPAEDVASIEYLYGVFFRAGPAINAAHSSRGSAQADFDNDGSLEVVIVNMGEPPSLLHNSALKKNWLLVTLEGVKANRDAIGARAYVHAGGTRLAGEVHGGSGFLSQNDSRLHFGLGDSKRYDRIEVLWPGGNREAFEGGGVNRIVRLKQGEGKPAAAAEED